MYAGGGIRWPGNGVFAVVTSKYDSNAAHVQITFARSVSKCLCSHRLLAEIPKAKPTPNPLYGTIGLRPGGAWDFT